MAPSSHLPRNYSLVLELGLRFICVSIQMESFRVIRYHTEEVIQVLPRTVLSHLCEFLNSGMILINKMDSSS